MAIINAAKIINKLAKTPAGKKAINKIKDKFKSSPSGKIAKKVENKARKESAAVAKKAREEARKDLKDDLNYDRNVALKTKGAGAIGAAGVGGALYGRSKIKEAEKENEKRRANNKPTFEFKQLKKEPIKKKAGGAIKAIKKIKDNAIVIAAAGSYPLSKKIQEEGRKAKAKAKAKNKKKGMKAGGIVDRQYLKGR
mgnify:FL=1